MGDDQQHREPDSRPGRLHRDAPQDRRHRTINDPLAVCDRPGSSPGLPGHRTMQALTSAFGDNVGFRADLSSYRKEIELDGEVNNAVLVVQNFLDCDLQVAVNVVGDLMNTRIRGIRVRGRDGAGFGSAKPA